MKTFKARGIVLREYEAGESDKRLVLLCKELGRLTVYVRGARKPKSKFMAAAQLFTYSDFVIADGRQFLSMAQVEVIESFYALRNDYERLCYAHLIMEACEKTILENTPCDDLLLLLLKALSLLNNNTLLASQIAGVFMLRFFLCYGLAPETLECAQCGGGLEKGVFFSDEGTVCTACAGAKPFKMTLSHGGLTALRHIMEAGVSEAFLFNANNAVQREIGQAWRLYWASHFDIKLQSEALLL